MNVTPFEALNVVPLLPIMIRMDTEAAQTAAMLGRINKSKPKAKKGRGPDLPEHRTGVHR